MIAVPRVTALVAKELAELRRNRSALLPVVLIALVVMVLPLFVAIAIPRMTGDPVSNDTDVRRALELASRDLPRAGMLSPEGAAQAFVFNRFAVLLLLVPVTGSITFAAHSLVSEKQGRSLEPLLASPITTAELLLSKVLGALIPSLAITAVTFVAYAALVWMLAEPDVLAAAVTGKTLLLIGVIGPLASAVAVQVGVLVSARVNDPRTAQQFGALLILPLTVLFVAQMTGAFILSPGFAVAIAVGLALLWLALLLLGVAIFQRETILTRWR